MARILTDAREKLADGREGLMVVKVIRLDSGSISFDVNCSLLGSQSNEELTAFVADLSAAIWQAAVDYRLEQDCIGSTVQ